MKKSKDSAEGGSSSSRTGGGRRWGRGHEDQCVSSCTTSNDGNNNDNDNNDKQQHDHDHDHDQEHHFTTKATSAAGELNVTADTVYQFYAEQLVPAVLSSLPILLHRVTGDVWRAFQAITGPICNWWFAVVPRRYDYHPPSLSDVWSAAAETSGAPSVADFMLRHFDVNGDGHISSAELLNMTDILNRLPPMPHYPHPAVPESWGMWFSREWPLFEWKVGVFLWRSFGGVIFALAVLSIVPGRMHGVAGKVLRWPLLALTYLLIGVELTVYTVIRVFIRLAEYAVARPRHRRLRRRMAAAVTYGEWYAHAAALDRSQGRDHWLERCYDDKTVGRYNWGFVKELIKDMRAAREKCDSLQALAVLQQCTRKNVGGVMSEDLFSYANTGEPKAIVREFVDEVAVTIHWVTDEAMKLDDTAANAAKNSNSDGGGVGVVGDNDKEHYEERLQKKVDHEKNKLWSIVMATASLLDHSNHHHHHNKNNNNNNNNHEDGNGSDDCNSTISTSNSSASSSSAAAGLPPFHREEVVRFLKRARFAYGKTALCLSGGAMMGAYHFGHVLGLLETGILPHIISGTSAGSVVGAILCTRTDEELKRVLTPEVLVTKLICFRRPWLERLKSVVENGHLFDIDEWLELIRWFTMGDMTFEEAYRRTGRVLCITLTSTTKKSPPMLLNYLSAPNVTIASAVVASAAVPGFVPPVRLRHKDARGVVTELGGEAYFDGSIERDIPVDGLAEMLNCQFFVACQCNPHVVPFFYNCKGGVGRPSRWSSGTQEDSWRGGFLLASLELYLKNHMRAKFRFLNEVEAAVGFTSTMMTQEFVGSTTIVPQVCFTDYFKLFTNPCLEDLYWYFQAGSVAAYEHTAMIKLHYSVADALDECLDKLEKTPGRDRDHVVARSKRRPKFTIPGTKKVTTPTTAASSSPLSSSSSSQPSSSSTTATTTSLSSTAPKPDGKHEKGDDDKEQEEYFDNPYPDELKEYEKNWIRLE